MTVDAFAAPLMGSVTNVRQVGSSMVRVTERCVTTQAMLAGPVDGQKFDFVRMIYGGTMTVLALDGCMWRCIQGGDVFVMTFNAGLATLVLDGKLFPFLDVTQAMVVVGKAGTMDTEVVGNEYRTSEKNSNNDTYSQPQGTQYVPFHFRLPLPTDGKATESFGFFSFPLVIAYVAATRSTIRRIRSKQSLAKAKFTNEYRATGSSPRRYGLSQPSI